MIIMSGTIGAGKSNLTEILSEHLGTKPFYEPVEENPILPLYYSDMKRYAFLLQIYFLNKRFRMIKQAMMDENNVLDRSIYEDSLFFHMNAENGNVTQAEVETYDDLLDNMMEELPYAAAKKAPDLLVHIDISLDTMLARIKKRGRPYEQIEQDPSLKEYYRSLIEHYGPWYEQYDASPKMKIDGDRYDFVSNMQDRRAVLTMIDEALLKLGKLTPEEYRRLQEKLEKKSIAE
ncbi:MAG: deoxynucleoside kinase [Solobacterium sp.]|jgi:deoxyadenosine/deoxycytidine kinase|nr:deoxynucleoside kinase [Solobacterium sp.]MCH4048448.1 deoxynucleoside kinase [Solobacterium sp.]MCH4074700.1 deoxynucleoside kinase [Solobacterium sp.]MCI1313881.1 deoxynucleoside kinase [Solobacterium sp.]MCI1346458.1 deoxynucleoside kinase [Solobacterium sp.]